MDFLLHLIEAYQFFQKNDIFPYINFRKLPNISNARWNSKAILAILSFILLPNHRPKLKRLCNYISGFWSQAWFSNQFFDDDIYFKLCYATNPFEKAFICLQKHWSTENTKIVTQRSNVCAERGISFLQKIDSCNKDTLNSKFIFSNNCFWFDNFSSY